MDDPNSAGYVGLGDPERPVIGTPRTTRIRPGARRPGRKPKDKAKQSKAAAATLAKVRADIQRSHAKAEFGLRTVELRLEGLTFPAIAVQMGEERGEVIRPQRVITAYYAHMENVAVTDRTRSEEVARLEFAAAKVWKRMIRMDDEGPDTVDVEVYLKAAETYLKYHERVAKLLGLDAATKIQTNSNGALPPGQGLDGGSVHIGPDGVTVHMPRSIGALQEWQQLSDAGLTDLAGEVMELESGDHSEILLPANFQQGEKAGLTLRPDHDARPRVEQRADADEIVDAEVVDADPEPEPSMTALEALDRIRNAR